MPDLKEIISLPVEDELHTCPDCGYTLGFHTSFVSTSASRDTPVRSTREVWRVILICPECGARYDVGWRVSFAEPGAGLRKRRSEPYRVYLTAARQPACRRHPLMTSTRPNNSLYAAGVMVIPGPAVTVRNRIAARLLEI